MESSATPYAAVVVINGIEHGRGMGGSKKEAKSEAARKTLELLIPDFKKLLEAKNGYVTKETVDLSVSLFLSFFCSCRLCNFFPYMYLYSSKHCIYICYVIKLKSKFPFQGDC